MLFAMVPIGKRCILLQAITIIVIAMNNNLTLDPGQFFFGYHPQKEKHNEHRLHKQKSVYDKVLNRGFFHRDL